MTYLELGRSGTTEFSNLVTLLESQESRHSSDAAGLSDFLIKQNVKRINYDLLVKQPMKTYGLFIDVNLDKDHVLESGLHLVEMG